jgi:hypothetical protein
MNDRADRDAADGVSERMILGIQTLVTGAGGVKDRLSIAGQDHLSPLSEGHFPKPLQAEFADIMAALTAANVEEESIRVTLAQISDADAVEIAKRIWGLFLRIQELRGRSLY